MSSKDNGECLPATDLAGLPPWMAKMRQAAMQSISEADVQAIVRGQIDAAKKGNKDAIKFVFDYILGAQQFKGATIVQNNNYGDSPAKPTKARPGSPEKLDAMARRAANHLPLTDDGDGPEINED